ncbi:transglycosylase family protein [Streptomyces coeruleoprunus]|uniref:Transglycosylase family protein n=1 Tax=Streptomyces coeruleoprunus TaxID=285563 RepID=A0ABV9XH99_9ACTN
MTGSAIALPLLGAGSASAADGATWDRVAECETGGMWSADLGNGYYGGLQLSQETWQAYGGAEYAPRADLASRAQQIDVAERVLAARGAGAWETCAPIAGLTTGGAATPDADAGATPSPKDPAAPTTPAPTPDASTSPDAGDKGATDTSGATPAPSQDAVLPDPSATPTAPATSSPTAPASPEAPAEQQPGTGKHRGEPAKEETADPAAPEGTDATVPDNSVTGRENGGHASRGDGTARDAGVVAADGTYTVREGDNLWTIADTHDLPGGWTALYDANREVVGADPNLILPGQSLDLDGKQG